MTIGRKSRLYLLVHFNVSLGTQLHCAVVHKGIKQWMSEPTARLYDLVAWIRRCGHVPNTLCLCDTKETKHNESGGLHMSVHYDSCTLSDLSLAQARRRRGKHRETT